MSPRKTQWSARPKGILNDQINKNANLTQTKPSQTPTTDAEGFSQQFARTQMHRLQCVGLKTKHLSGMTSKALKFHWFLTETFPALWTFFLTHTQNKFKEGRGKGLHTPRQPNHLPFPRKTRKR